MVEAWVRIKGCSGLPLDRFFAQDNWPVECVPVRQRQRQGQGQVLVLGPSRTRDGARI